MVEKLRIATRNSPLALWQAEHVRARLAAAHPDLSIEVIGMSTEGDRRVDVSLASVGGKGLFLKELEQALVTERADLAVHSTKDMTAELPQGLQIGALLAREDPRDALVAVKFEHLAAMPMGTRIGTSSLRRRCQLLHHRPDLAIVTLRGNVGTRLAKLDSGEVDGLILAAAGLKRLGLEERIRQYFSSQIILPAVGQGVLAIEVRAADSATQALIQVLNDPATEACVRAERAVNARLDGSCHLPIAAYARHVEGELRLEALVGSLDGSELISGVMQGLPSEPERLGAALAGDLLGRGADSLLASIAKQLDAG